MFLDRLPSLQTVFEEKEIFPLNNINNAIDLAGCYVAEAIVVKSSYIV